jgi:hypothetical protein
VIQFAVLLNWEAAAAAVAAFHGLEEKVSRSKSRTQLRQAQPSRHSGSETEVEHSARSLPNNSLGPLVGVTNATDRGKSIIRLAGSKGVMKGARSDELLNEEWDPNKEVRQPRHGLHCLQPLPLPSRLRHRLPYCLCDQVAQLAQELQGQVSDISFKGISAKTVWW